MRHLPKVALRYSIIQMPISHGHFAVCVWKTPCCCCLRTGNNAQTSQATIWGVGWAPASSCFLDPPSRWRFPIPSHSLGQGGLFATDVHPRVRIRLLRSTVFCTGGVYTRFVLFCPHSAGVWTRVPSLSFTKECGCAQHAHISSFFFLCFPPPREERGAPGPSHCRPAGISKHQGQPKQQQCPKQRPPVQRFALVFLFFLWIR